MIALISIIATILRIGLVAFFAYKVFTLVAALRRPDTDFPSASPHDKLLWAAAVFLLPLGIGAALYEKLACEKQSRFFGPYLYAAAGWGALYVVLYLIVVIQGAPGADMVHIF